MSKILSTLAGVNAARQSSYGSPLENFTRTAMLWNGYLDARSPSPFKSELTAQDVASLMMLFKMARLIKDPRHQDSVVDLLGYAETYAMVHEATEPLEQPLTENDVMSSIINAALNGSK